VIDAVVAALLLVVVAQAAIQAPQRIDLVDVLEQRLLADERSP
jgi:hypothetical protein